jgi:hypothetical protein
MAIKYVFRTEFGNRIVAKFKSATKAIKFAEATNDKYLMSKEAGLLPIYNRQSVSQITREKKKDRKRRAAIKAELYKTSKELLVINELRKAGVQLHKTAFIKRVSRYACEIAVVDSNGNIPFGCEVKINLQMSKDKEFQLQFGTTGAFSPKSSPSSLIRTMHAAQLLEHWDAVCQIMGKHFPYEQTK